MVTFREYIGRSIDCLIAALKEKTNAIKGCDNVPVIIEYQLPPVSEDDVRQLAYFKWEQAGRPETDGKDFWLAAEQELNSPLVEDLLLQQ